MFFYFSIYCNVSNSEKLFNFLLYKSPLLWVAEAAYQRDNVLVCEDGIDLVRGSIKVVALCTHLLGYIKLPEVTPANDGIADKGQRPVTYFYPLPVYHNGSGIDKSRKAIIRNENIHKHNGCNRRRNVPQ